MGWRRPIGFARRCWPCVAGLVSAGRLLWVAVKPARLYRLRAIPETGRKKCREKKNDRKQGLRVSPLKIREPPPADIHIPLARVFGVRTSGVDLPAFTVYGVRPDCPMGWAWLMPRPKLDLMRRRAPVRWAPFNDARCGATRRLRDGAGSRPARWCPRPPADPPCRVRGCVVSRYRPRSSSFGCPWAGAWA